MTETDDVEELRRQWLAKYEEIAGLVAEHLGFGPLKALNAEQRQRVDDDVDEMIENHDEALLEGDTVEEWNALDERLASTAVGRLLQELHDLSDHIMYLENQDLDDPDEDSDDQ